MSSPDLNLRVLRCELPQAPHPALQLATELLVAPVGLLQLTDHALATCLSLQALQAAVQAGLHLQQLLPVLLDPQVVDLQVLVLVFQKEGAATWKN